MIAERIGELERRLGNIVRPGKVVEADYPKARVKVQIGANVTAWLPWITSRAGGDQSWHAPEVGEQVVVISPVGEFSTGYVLPGVYQNDYPAPADAETVSRIKYADGAVIEYNRADHVLSANLTDDGKAVVITGDNTSEQTKDRTLLKLGESASIEMTADTIAAKLGDAASVELTETAVTAKLGASASVDITGSAITLKLGGTTFEIGAGGITANQTITVTGGDVVADTTSLRTHVHGGVESGSSVSGPPVT
ncbi:MAG TPA: phage baseplate assembly protein V [Chthoniobacteraceae bacterium]|nr:phage baseplate assembly protein V [Chthoniobacteraceae bacterium]